LRSGANDAGLDVLHARAAAVDRDDEHAAVGFAGALQRFPRTGSGRLVDRVDDGDVRALLQRVLHSRTALVGIALAHFVIADARIVLVAVFVGVFNGDAEAGHKALV